MPSPSPLKRHLHYAQNWLRAVAAVTSTDVWAVGETRDTDFPHGLDDTLTEHWDGIKWSVVSSPDPGGPNAYNSFWGATALGDGRVWAVGSVGLNRLQPFSELWNGGKWVIAGMPQSGQGDLWAVGGGRGGDIWAVGDTTAIGITSRYAYVLDTLIERCSR